MQRYFASLDNLGNVILNKDDVFHIEKVMRMRINDQFEANVNGTIYLLQISGFNPLKYSNISINKEEMHELNGYIRLLYCLPKGEKTDLVIQKAVELGIKEIVLINSTRSIAKIDSSNKDKKLARYNKIIKEASEQSKRTNLLTLTDVISFNEINNYQADINLIAYEKSNKSLLDLENILNNVKNKVINVIIGAEGGLTIEEVNYAFKLGYLDISLGNRILRSETACIYIMSLLSFFMER